MKLLFYIKQLTAFLLLAAMLTQVFSKPYIIADYYSNTAKYAKNCINKTKPQLQCKGKCQMMKKLKEEEKKDQQNPERKADNKNEEVLSSKSFFSSISPDIFLDLLPKHYNPYLINTVNEQSFSIFHPPPHC